MSDKTIRLTVDLTYNPDTMHGDDEDSIEWFNKILLGDDLQLGDFGDLGDMIGSIKVVPQAADRIEELEAKNANLMDLAHDEHKRAMIAEAKLEKLERWQTAAFIAHNNLDLDIEANPEALEAEVNTLKGKKTNLHNGATPMKRQVYLNLYGHWSDIIEESHVFILAKDVDGVMTYIIKDGQERTREQ